MYSHKRPSQRALIQPFNALSFYCLCNQCRVIARTAFPVNNSLNSFVLFKKPRPVGLSWVKLSITKLLATNPLDPARNNKYGAAEADIYITAQLKVGVKFCKLAAGMMLYKLIHLVEDNLLL